MAVHSRLSPSMDRLKTRTQWSGSVKTAVVVRYRSCPMNRPSKPMQVVPAPMTGQFLKEVLDELDTAKAPTRHERRKYDRLGHRSLRAVLIVSEGGRDVGFFVATRNLSRGGACFLHRQMMYDDDQCRVILPLPDTKHLLVPARTVRCRHIRGMLHEIGVRFTRPLGAEELEGALRQGEGPS